MLFAHVPKTGGTAIERAFSDSGFGSMYRDMSPPHKGARALRRCSPQHLHAQLLCDLFRLDLFAITFTVVRDPVARFRSEFLYRNRRSGASLTPELVETWGIDVLNRRKEDPYVHDNHLRPQHEFVTPGMQVYRYEDGLDVVVRSLREDHGVGVTAGLTHVNEPQGLRSDDVPITPRLLSALLATYEADFELFGYSADG
ncbi:sulfotransferase family 2 domain-containing protein [Nocardioides rubriscoriae]|uniref:sulfotransferase family 2 domain-containing protein n=1 Tax=Nocardioides rubriscoriae TaxID=642762 RepID=UPI001478827E|nr:sulfotransferase family 2 domain-containing protein [Nocardioides rubriscoriae]